MSFAVASYAQDTLVREVIVSGERLLRPVDKAAIGTRVIDGGELIEQGYGDMLSALKGHAAGFTVQQTSFGAEMSMQGLDARHVLLLQDGERLAGDMAGNIDMERFNLHAIDRVELVKGASSTLYGSRATGAVINMVSRRAVKPFELRAGLRYGQNSQTNFPDASKADFNYMFEHNADRPNLSAWLSAGAKRGCFAFQTDADYGSTDAFYMRQATADTKTYTREANPFLPHNITIVSTAPRPPMGIEGKEHASLTQSAYFDRGRVSLRAKATAFFMNTYDLIRDLSFSQTRDYSGSLRATVRLPLHITATASVHADIYDRFKRSELQDSRAKVYRDRIIQPRLTIDCRHFDGHTLTLGAEHTDDRLTSDRFANATTDTRYLSETEWWLQDQWNATESLNIEAGLRTNYSQAFGLHACPKLAARWEAADGLALRATWSMGYRAPSIKELFFDWDHLGMFRLRGNKDLRPERSHYLALGAEYSRGTIFASASAYANIYRDKIEGQWRVYDMQYNFEYTNLHRQTLTGLDALVRWRPIARLTLNATYSYVHVSKTDGRQLSTSAPHAATASADYTIVRRQWRMKASLTATISGERRYDVQDRVYIDELGANRNAYFRVRLPAYAILGLAVVQTFRQHYRLTVGVDNLTGYKPRTLGSGLTMFNVPATAGARAYAQIEITI